MANCRDNGHIFGPGSKCIFCSEPQPAVSPPPPPASFAALREQVEAMLLGSHADRLIVCSDTVEAVLALLDAEAAAPAAVDALAEMERRKDEAYHERNQVVAGLAAVALANGWRTGTARTAIEGWSEDWHGCVYIDLPTGQTSWHFHDSQAGLFAFLPPYVAPWDGHDTPEKYRRVLALATPPPSPAEAALTVVPPEVVSRFEDEYAARLYQRQQEERTAPARAEAAVQPDAPGYGPTDASFACDNPAECCRELSRVWEALGISTYNGKSASENVAAMRSTLAAPGSTKETP